MSRPYNYERIMRELRQCSREYPLTLQQVRDILGLGLTASHKMLSRMVQQGRAVRYQPGEYGPAPKQPEAQP